MGTDPLNLNREDSGSEEGQKTFISPPAADIAIRTMQSDIASFAVSGGGKPQSVQIANTTWKPEPDSSIQGPGIAAKLRTLSLIILGVIAVVVFVGIIVYLLISSYLKKPNETAVVTPSNNPSTTTTPSPSPVAATFQSITVHRSFFRKSADATVTFTLTNNATSASALLTYSQKLNSLISNTNSLAKFIEITSQAPGSNPLSFGEFLEAIHIPLFDPSVVSDIFNPDFTFFVYRDNNGIWPGYIIQLKPDKNWLFVKSEVAQMEERQVEVLFATSPGIPSGNFKDDTINNQPIRVLNYSTPGAQFLYGWTRGYLIISTSQDGFKEATSRL